MPWVRLAISISVFVTTCGGLGYFADFLIRRWKWRVWILPLAVLAIAFIWPILLVTYTIYDARRYQAAHPRDDAPGMVVYSMMVAGAPILFVASIPPTVVGAFISRLRGSKRHDAA